LSALVNGFLLTSTSFLINISEPKMDFKRRGLKNGSFLTDRLKRGIVLPFPLRGMRN